MSDEKFGMSPLREAAVQIHEMYEELKRAGFSRKEALELTSKVITGAFSASVQDEDPPNE